jgi:hypothetical protein
MSICLVLLLVFVIAPIVLLFVRTAAWIRWLSFFMAVCIYALAMLSALPRNADIPPLHLMISFLLWSVTAWRHWFHPSKRRIPRGHCQKCGYDLTANVSGVCPECGEKV